MLYALSTCGWCRKTKEFFDDLGIEYSFVYADYLEGDEKNKLMDEVRKWNPRGSFPTIVINEKKAVVGFREDELREALNL